MNALSLPVPAATDRSVRSRGAAVLMAVVSIALLLLGGCATQLPVRTDVTTFHQWQNAEPLTFSFRRSPEQQQSLEHLAYEAQVGARLEALGFRPAPAGSARYQVGIRHATTTQLQRRTEYPFHPYPPSFGGYWFHPRPGHGAALMHIDPWFWGPPMPLVRDVPTAIHTLRVDLYDMQGAGPDGRKVFESSARTTGSHGGLPAVMPALVAAVFQDFPGPSGRTRQVVVDLQPVR